MSDHDVQKALATLKRHGWEVDPEAQRVGITEDHLYVSQRHETEGGMALVRSAAIPLKLIPQATSPRGWGWREVVRHALESLERVESTVRRPDDWVGPVPVPRERSTGYRPEDLVNVCAEPGCRERLAPTAYSTFCPEHHR